MLLCILVVQHAAQSYCTFDEIAETTLRVTCSQEFAHTSKIPASVRGIVCHYNRVQWVLNCWVCFDYINFVTITSWQVVQQGHQEWTTILVHHETYGIGILPVVGNADGKPTMTKGKVVNIVGKQFRSCTHSNVMKTYKNIKCLHSQNVRMLKLTILSTILTTSHYLG